MSAYYEQGSMNRGFQKNFDYVMWRRFGFDYGGGGGGGQALIT